MKGVFSCGAGALGHAVSVRRGAAGRGSAAPTDFRGNPAMNRENASGTCSPRFSPAHKKWRLDECRFDGKCAKIIGRLLLSRPPPMRQCTAGCLAPFSSRTPPARPADTPVPSAAFFRGPAVVVPPVGVRGEKLAQVAGVGGLDFLAVKAPLAHVGGHLAVPLHQLEIWPASISAGPSRNIPSSTAARH